MNEKVLFVLDNIEHGGIASAVLAFYESLVEIHQDLKIDFLVFAEPSQKTIEALRKNSSRVHVIPSVGVRPFRFMKNVYRVMKNNGPYDAVHVHNAYFIWITAIAARLAKTKRIIGHAHGSKGKTKSKIFEILAFIGRIFNPMFCTNSFACAHKSGKWTFGKKYEFLPNITKMKEIAVCNKEDYKQEFCLKENDTVIGYFGVFEIEKNAEFLADIMKEFRGEEYVCVAAGNGSRWELAKRRIEDYKLDNIKLIGYRKDGNRLMQFFDVLVAPSFSEGMSLSLLEAQLLGIPCVVSAGVPKTNDLQLGLYYEVPDYNPMNWKQAILLAKENGCSKTYEERIAQLAVMGYDRKSVAERLYHAYVK